MLLEILSGHNEESIDSKGSSSSLYYVIFKDSDDHSLIYISLKLNFLLPIDIKGRNSFVK